MRITDFALIFIGVVLPIIIIVYINVSFTIKAIEEESYYQKIINSALEDAAMRMKEVENDDKENDYGYSGEINNKVSVNAQVAVNTFFNSLYNNFSIKGNKDAEKHLKYFVPAIAVIDYNGVYISSMEEYDTLNSLNQLVKETNHVVKPKRYFSFTYGINYNASGGTKITTDPTTIQALSNQPGFSLHTVEFSMDDYIVHRGNKNDVTKTYTAKGFYIGDTNNNSDLYDGSTDVSLKTNIINLLKSKRKDTIIDVITRELNFAVNKNNHYANIAGVKYTFVFPYTTKEEMYRYVEDIGMLAFVQGMSVGNKYLNYKAYGGASLELSTKYYVSTPNNGANGSKYFRNLYHKDIKCPEYIVSNKVNITPQYVNTKQQAASLKAAISDGEFVEGFYPCPLCRP
ncbi:MAG: hypothetical protein PHD15_01660 [Clostridia bacterium]|nr:hypothetical protein [Clostridia bacterium]MDD4386457.1 hypothetical protein [Clostridia bacterium]